MSHKITVFRGDGIGPELVDNVLKILKAADAPLEYEIFNVGEDEWKRNGALIPEEAYASFERTKVLLKSPITTPVGKRIPLPECNTSRSSMICMPISARLSLTRQ